MTLLFAADLHPNLDKLTVNSTKCEFRLWFGWFDAGNWNNQEQSRIRKPSARWGVARDDEWPSAEWNQVFVGLDWVLTNGTERDRGLTSTQPSSAGGAAAHLAGFMGEELTSGRLPRYPSSVWKLIPSSVSKPWDPSAESQQCDPPTQPVPPLNLSKWKSRRPQCPTGLKTFSFSLLLSFLLLSVPSDSLSLSLTHITPLGFILPPHGWAPSRSELSVGNV